MKNTLASQLWRASRPKTGVYAFVLTFISFGFYENTPWSVRLLTATAFLGMTMSIMVFNDWKDRLHDQLKGKSFAFTHPAEIFQYWLCLVYVVILLLGILASYDNQTALFCTTVWLIGILYSFIQHWYIVQTVVVALCAASPALCGMVYHSKTTRETVLVFLIFSSLQFIREIYGDLRDIEADRGYKATMPIRLGHSKTVMSLIVLCFLPGTCIMLLANIWVIILIGLISLPALEYQHAKMLQNPEKLAGSMKIMDGTIMVLLVILFFT